MIAEPQLAHLVPVLDGGDVDCLREDMVEPESGFNAVSPVNPSVIQRRVAVSRSERVGEASAGTEDRTLGQIEVVPRSAWAAVGAQVLAKGQH